ncbi:hypothetical protein LSAT2_009729 [Lamellibrachia satsuma]|nr:hypothetical protein LSAT2_009729 [Lamellibrachia satsuma]
MNDHSQCASHNGAMTAGATVNKSCTATGRYLSFRRTGGGENHWTTLCEVVVIGHRYVSCQQCPSTCNVVIGCDVCAPGKQQPDCVHYCDDGNYGVNCNESCGHCKKHSKCSITNGSCSKGCENWYISDVCKTYIASPGFHSSVKPDVDDVTTTSATVSWPRASNISTGLGGHYYYVLWLQADGESSKNITRVEQSAGEQRMEAQITGLTADTAYSLRVEPYRQHNGERGGGTATGVTRFKTRPTDSAPLQTTECAAQCAAALGTGAWIGIAVGTFLLGLVTMALLLLGIPRLRQSSGNAGKERQGMEMSSRYNTDEAVEDAHGYVIPPTKVPKEEGGVVDDASGYYNVASESRQPESHNVYDVIQT